MLISTMSKLGLVLSGTNTDIDVWETQEEETEPSGGVSSSEKETPPEEKKEEEETPEEEDASGGGSGSEDEPEEEEPEEESSGGSEEDSEEEDSEEDSEEGSSGSDEEDPDEEESSESSGSASEEDSDEEESSDSSEEENSSEENESEENESGGSDSNSSESSSDEEDSSDEEGASEITDATEGQEGNNGGSPESGSSEEAVLAEDLLEAMEEGKSSLKDNNQALSEAMGKAQDEEAGELQQGERAWKPSSTAGDTVTVPAIPKGSEGARVRRVAQKLREDVKGPVSSLTSKLRTKFLQARTPQTVHGVKKGNALSERRLVESFVELKSGYRPTRPDWQREIKEDVSLACAVVLDESGSMSSLVLEVGKAALAVAEPLSNLGSPCLVIGPRNAGPGVKQEWFGYTEGCHRTSTVTIDLFKDWDEKITACWERFGKVMAAGSTPLEDGIQYAMVQMNKRQERHRVILVVTDGAPDNWEVVKHQIRIADEAGVSIIGVGISEGCRMVKTLFPKHIAVEDINQLPQALLGVLDSVMFPARAKKMNLSA